MSARMPIAQTNAVPPVAIVAARTSSCPGTYQKMDEAAPARKAKAINVARIGKD